MKDIIRVLDLVNDWRHHQEKGPVYSRTFDGITLCPGVVLPPCREALERARPVSKGWYHGHRRINLLRLPGTFLHGLWYHVD